MSTIQQVVLHEVVLQSGARVPELSLSYQHFGQPLHAAPVVVVNHALTGNSTVSGPQGWWDALIGPGCCIDTHKFAVLAIDIPGNGFAGTQHLIEDYRAWVAADVAALYWRVIDRLQIPLLYALIGGSLGGGIAWEMAVARPQSLQHLIPVACSWKASDWLLGNTRIQEQLLLQPSRPLQLAREHAMLLYRSPHSLQAKFGSQPTEGDSTFDFQIESWLHHHGEKLQQRFQLKAYRLMNQLLRTVDVFRNRKQLNYNQWGFRIHQVAIDTDLLFPLSELRGMLAVFKAEGLDFRHGEIASLHGHDGFLIEFEALAEFLQPVFQQVHNKDTTTHFQLAKK